MNSFDSKTAGADGSAVEPFGEAAMMPLERTLISSMNEGFIVYDRELRYRLWNPFMERLTGVTAAEVLGRRAVDVFPQLMEEGIDRLLHRALQGQWVESADTQFRIPSTGRTGWVIGRYGPHRNDAGEIVGAIGLVQDITERKHAELSLASSERELEIHNRIAEAFITEPDEEMYETVLDIVMQVFDSRHGIFGYIDDEGSLVCPSMTRDVFELCRVPDKSIVFRKESWAGIWGRALMSKRSSLSNSAGSVPDGHIAIKRCVFAPIVDRDELIGLLAIANRDGDYTETDQRQLEDIAGHIGPILHARLARDAEERVRKRTEQALLASERRYKAVVDLQSEFVVRFTSDGILTFTNHALRRFFKVNSGELLGRNFFTMLNRENRHIVKRHLASLTTADPVGEVEIDLDEPDGGRRWLSWTTRALFDDQDQVEEFQAAGRDVTERKTAEDELRRTLAEKESLLREIHHRVKNNMAVISSMLSLQSDSLTDRDSLEAIAAVRSRIRAMALVHEQLYSSGDFRRVDLGAYVESLVNSMIGAGSERIKGIEFRRRIADIVVPIGDAIPCALILNELVSNAVKHAFPDGRRGEITVAVEGVEGGCVELTVSDNGVGRAANQRRGLGLQLVELLAKQLGGDAESTWDQGARFTVRFRLESSSKTV